MHKGRLLQYMSKYRGLSEFISFNSEFRNAINLDLNLNHKGKLLSYIPTKSSIDILKRYLKAIKNNTMHASMLIGPYGKGKSHLLLVLLAILSLNRNSEADRKIYKTLVDRISKVDDEAALLMNDIWKDSLGKFLPVVINCQEDVNQAFLLGLNKALKRAGLGELTPKTDYEYAVKTIDNWKESYPETYSAYHDMLKNKKISLNAMKAELLQYNKEYLGLFKEIYPLLTSGSVFNPLAESDVTRVYMSVADQLREEHSYRGLYIVFDEFSKFIEGQDKISAGLNMKLVQDVCEMAGDSKDPQIYITLVAHKPIKEYGNKLSQETINSFTGIEGRLDAEVLFVTSAKNNYELIENAILKEKNCLENVPTDIENRYFNKKIVSENFAVPAFESEFTLEDFENIVVKGCYPLTPIAAYSLLSISEKVAQNERTLFTFISKNEPGSMPEYVNSSVGAENLVSDKWAVTPDMIFDYFTSLFKDETDEIKGVYQKAITALEIVSTKYKHNEAPIRIIKTLAIMMIINKGLELPWNEDLLRLAVNMNYSDSVKERFSDAISILFSMDILELDGSNFYKFKTVQGRELEEVIAERWRLVANENTVKDELQSIYPVKYVFPKKYNYEFAMTRYFRYIFCNVEDFLKMNSINAFFDDAAFCDGRVVCLYQLDEVNYSQQVKEKVFALQSHKIMVMYAHKIFSIEDDVLKLQVVKDIKEDYSFIEKNPHLSPEIQGLEEYLEMKILTFLDSVFGRFGEYEISYYLKDQVVSKEACTISECIDDLCYQIYDKTPIINNEFVNKQNITTGATKTARKNIMAKLLNNESVKEYMSGTSQDSTIYRALFVRTGIVAGDIQDNMQGVLDIFNTYVDNCSGKREKISKLVNKVTSEPYGMRMGLIPIFLSYVIGQRHADIVVYYGDKEIPLTTDTVVNMCDYPEQYELFVAETDVERNQYLDDLINVFGLSVSPNAEESRISQIFAGMQKWYRSLHQVTINAKGDDTFFDGSFYKKALMRMSNILQRYEVNPFEALFVLIPEAFDTKNDYTACIERLKLFKNKMGSYYEWIIGEAVRVTKEAFGNSDDPLSHTLINWYDRQSNLAKGTIDDKMIASFMRIIATLSTTDVSARPKDTVLIDDIVKAITGVHIEYWNAKSIEQYNIKLKEIKEKIEKTQDEELTEINEKSVYTSRNGQQFFYEKVDSDETEMFRDVLVGTIEDFEGLGKNDLISVLLDEVERILQNK